MRRLTLVMAVMMAAGLILAACAGQDTPRPVLTQDLKFPAYGTILLQKGSMVQYIGLKFVPDEKFGEFADEYGWWELEGFPDFQGRDGLPPDRGTWWWSYDHEFQAEIISDGNKTPTEIHVKATGGWTVTHIDGTVQDLQTE